MTNANGRPRPAEIAVPRGLFELVSRSTAGTTCRLSNSASISVSSELVGERERGGVELGAADDVGHGLTVEQAKRFVERPGPLGTVRAPLPVARDDHVSPARERAEALGQRVPGLATHHDRMAHRELAEVRHVLGQMPGDGSVPADHTAAGDRRDEDDLHTATGARIAGWCW